MPRAESERPNVCKRVRKSRCASDRGVRQSKKYYYYAAEEAGRGLRISAQDAEVMFESRSKMIATV